MIPARTQNRAMPAPPAKQSSLSRVTFAQVDKTTKRGQRSLLYGTGGVGKTTLACASEGKVAFIDADESLPILRKQLEILELPLPVVVPCSDWKSLRTSLHSSGWDSITDIVLDTGTMLEQWCVAHVLKNVKAGTSVAQSIEDYGYGKGFKYVFEEFTKLLADLDTHMRAGRNVIMTAHDCTSTVPNPAGPDWLRYEPRLQNPAGGNNSIRLRVKEWSDNTLWLGYDVNVEKENKTDKKGKAEGSGTRTLYCHERPFCMAKSRTCSVASIDIEHGKSPWAAIYGKE